MAPREGPYPASTDVRRQVSRRIAGAYFLFAGAWILISDLALFELTKDLPSFAGASLIKGSAFVLVTTILLYLLISHQLRSHAESAKFAPKADSPTPARFGPVAAFSAFSLLAVALVLVMFSYESRRLHEEEHDNLRAILELKADQLALLLSQRRDTARSYGQSRGLRDDMTHLARGPDASVVSGITNRIEELRHDQKFDSVLMLDAAGNLIAGAGPEGLRQPSPELVALAARSMASGTPVAHYLHRDAQLPGEPILIDYITPLAATSDGQNRVGAIVLRENARGRLFRLIENWPTPSPTAEILLVRRDGDHVLYLNDLRHAKDTAFRLRRPMSETALPAVKAVSTAAPLVIDGSKDYRGVDVVAVSRPIAGTDWFMIAKIDRDEILAPLRRSATIWMTSILCMVLLAVGGVGFLWRQQLRLVAANEFAEAAGRRRAEDKLDVAEERYRALFERSLDCVFLADLEGNFLDANRAALDLLGYRREEISSINYRSVMSADQLPRAFAALKEVVQTGAQQQAQEYTLRKKDGGQVTVESKTVLVYSEGEPSAVLGVARDVTERKRIQRELELKNTVLSTQQEASPDAILVVNENARIISHNRKFIEMLGIPEELMRAGDDGPVLKHVIGQIRDPDAFLAKVRYLYDHREETSHDEILTKDGRIVDRHSSPAIGPDGVYYGRVWYFRDITMRKRTEDAIAQLAAIVENSIDAIVSRGLDRTIRSWNPAAERLFGWKAEDVIGRSIAVLIPPEREDESIRNRELLARSAGVPAYNTVRLTKDGRRIDVSLGHSSIRSPNGEVIGVSLVFRDITARLKAELDQARLAAIVESSSDAIVSRGMDGKVLSWNAAAEHMFGWSRQEALGQPITIIVPPERRGELRPLIERVVAGENIGVIESTHRRKNGTRIDTAITFSAIRDAAGNATAVSLIYRDITQQKLAEVALLESEQRFRAMIEQSISGFYVIQDDRFTYVNARFAEIFGYASSDEIVGKHPSELVAEKDRATVAGNIQRRLSREAMSLSYTFTGVRKDGKEVDIGVHGALATYQGQPVIMGLLQDISDRKLAEEQIRRYVAQLEQAMQSTINVVATIGELRDPYTHGHERRVGEIAAAIATEMGLDQNQVEGIRIAGYLHDVGKIAVPAEILAKPTKLTKAEFDLVKDHARQSYDILKTVPFPWPVAEAAWQHHERMDGSGYPRGLKGEEIIVESRILAVADTVEAMSSHRPYRPGLGIDKALAEIERSRGKLFCPEAADACLRLFREKGFTLPA